MTTNSFSGLTKGSIVQSAAECQGTDRDDFSPSASVELIKESPLVISTRNVLDSSSDSLSSEENISLDELQQSLIANLKIEELENDFDIITKQFENSIYQSLEKSNTCMLPCFNVVCENDCKPQGSFAVLDIGGSTLRVSVVRFLGNNTAECVVNKSWTIEDDNKHLDRSFFLWVTKNFKSLVDEHTSKILKNSRGNIKVGITWSFPIIQHVASNRGIVSDLGKGFSICEEFKGGDLKDIFEECFLASGIPIEIYAIVNDSVSVLVTGSYFNNAKIGLVQGTGTNSAFLVDRSLVGERKTEYLTNTENDKKTLINTEASFLGYHLYKYVCDADKDMYHLWRVIGDPGYTPPHMTTDAYGVFQPLEMITSGRYIPEIIRRIIADYFPDSSASDKNPEYTLTAELLAQLYRCTDYEEFGSELKKTILLNSLKEDDMMALKVITKMVIYRAAIVLASYIVAMVRVSNFTHLDELEISAVGSMLRYFPGYKEAVLKILETKARKCRIPRISFDFIEDSSIYGASIAAYVNQQRMGL